MSGALEKAFLEDIVANIDDDTPRLIYADWLTDNDRDDRAEFIRVQVDLARLPTWHPARTRLALREQALLKQHGDAWLAELPKVSGAKWTGFRRGLVAEVSFRSFQAMREHAHACRAIAPVEAVAVNWPRRRESRKEVPPIAELRELTLDGRPFDREIAWLAASPQLATLHTLSVLGLTVDDLAQLLASPHLGRLRVLNLLSNGLGNAGVRVLTEAGTLTALEELDLTGPGYHESYYQDPIITEDGMAMLAGWPGLASVRSLTLEGSRIHAGGLRALLNSPNALALKTLSLRNGQLEAQEMAAFTDAPARLRLEWLDLGGNLVHAIGAESLANAPCLSELKTLLLNRCEVPLTGARNLAQQAAFLTDLRILNVGDNHFGPAGLEALLERAQVLQSLQIRGNDLFDKGAALLAASPASDALAKLDLRNNGIGPDGARALGESAHLRNLLILRLEDNSIPESEAVALAASPLGQRLAVLETKSPPREPWEFDEEENPF